MVGRRFELEDTEVEVVPVPESTWYDRPGWGLSHRLRPDATEEFFGERYNFTLCGRRVRAADITVAEPWSGDRCKRCARHAGQAYTG